MNSRYMTHSMHTQLPNPAPKADIANQSQHSFLLSQDSHAQLKLIHEILNPSDMDGGKG